jgi:phosphoglucosamine mutase
MFPQVLINRKFVPGMDPLHDPRVQDAVREAESRLGGQGRVLLRKSGTEPLIRVMVEGSDGKLVSEMAGYIADQIQEGS